MKKILLFAAVLMFSASMVFAQDISMEDLTAPDAPILRKGVAANLSVQIVNNGPNTINGGTIIPLKVEIGNNPVQSINFPLVNPLPSGDSYNLMLYPTFENEPLGAIEICIWSEYAADGNSANDQTCSNFELVTYKRDIGMTAIPIPLPNSIVEKQTSYSFTFTLKNFSDSAISVNTRIPYQVRFGTGTPEEYYVDLTTDMLPNSEASYSSPVIEVPATVPNGPIEICFETAWSTVVDDVQTNNEFCQDYQIAPSGIKENNFAGSVAIQPNPFDEQTQITYALATSSEVVLKIYTLAGKEVQTLVNEKQAAGKHAADFDASALEKGIYIYRLQSGEVSKTGRLVVQ
ncbi:MAG: T9SS type A sorting domain-containing protein [Bacteroidia bacterium]